MCTLNIICITNSIRATLNHRRRCRTHTTTPFTRDSIFCRCCCCCCLASRTTRRACLLTTATTSQSGARKPSAKQQRRIAIIDSTQSNLQQSNNGASEQFQVIETQPARRSAAEQRRRDNSVAAGDIKLNLDTTTITRTPISFSSSPLSARRALSHRESSISKTTALVESNSSKNFGHHLFNQTVDHYLPLVTNNDLATTTDQHHSDRITNKQSHTIHPSSITAEDDDLGLKQSYNDKYLENYQTERYNSKSDSGGVIFKQQQPEYNEQDIGVDKASATNIEPKKRESFLLSLLLFGDHNSPPFYDQNSAEIEKFNKVATIGSYPEIDKLLASAQVNKTFEYQTQSSTKSAAVRQYKVKQQQDYDTLQSSHLLLPSSSFDLTNNNLKQTPEADIILAQQTAHFLARTSDNQPIQTPSPSQQQPTDIELITTTSVEYDSIRVTSVIDYFGDMIEKGYLSTLALGLIILVTFAGNVLVCLSVIKVRKLRHPSNYLLISLAISDLCVACVVMPFGLYVSINDNWQLGKLLCNVYVVSDVTSCTASILNLCVISIDRYFAITRPLTYCIKRTTRTMMLSIGGVWILACLISVPPLLTAGNEYGTENEPRCEVSQAVWYQLYATCMSFYIPLIVMICLYYNIYKAAKRVVEAERRATTGLHVNNNINQKCNSTNINLPNCTENKTTTLDVLPNKTSSAMRERKASVTLGVIMSAFTICWLPFFIIALLRPFSKTVNSLPRAYVLLTLWLGYANSLLNPIIYVTFHHDFRNAFKHLLCLRCMTINENIRKDEYKSQYGELNH